MAEQRKRGGKKPAHLAGPVSVEQTIWSAIRNLAATGAPFTRADIEFTSEQKPHAVRSYVGRLVLGGFLQGLAEKPRSPTCPHFTWQQYTLARDVGLQAPRLCRDGSPRTLGVARERMWQVIRIQRAFSALDVQLAVEAGGDKVSYATAKSYVNKLATAGYLRAISPARSGPGRRGATWRLLPSMNSGPRSPVMQANGAVYDPNKDQLVWRPK